MLTLFFRGEVDAALAVARARLPSIRTTPNSQVNMVFGSRLSGQWRPGCALVSETVTRNPGPVDI